MNPIGALARPLHIIAPSFYPGVVGGAGEAFLELTERFLSFDPGTRIFMNAAAAELYPQWRDSISVVRTADMRSNLSKAVGMLKLALFGLSQNSREAVCWFPFGTAIPYRFQGRGVVTLHDTLHLDIPAAVQPAERLFRHWILPATMKSCRIVTSSRFSQNQIRRHFGVGADVVPLGLVPLPDPEPVSIGRPFAFYPANSWPHKNHEFLLETWSGHTALRELALVFTLGSGMGGLDRAIARARAAGVDVIVTGRISRGQLAGYYEQATCTVFPSLYEGFGLPVEEALSRNCPILISNQGSLPELVGPDYPYILPLDTQAWADAVLQLASSTKQQWSSFRIGNSWDLAARSYWETFKSLC